MTYPRPTLHWQRSGVIVGAEVQVCRDRACTMVVSTFDATGSSGSIPVELVSGAYFWRLRGITATGRLATWSPTWEFWLSSLRPPRDAAYGTVLDLDGDGQADLAIAAPSTTPGQGRIYLWRGPLTAPSTPLVLTSRDESAVGFGHAVACLGDVDGDGITDLGVSAYDPAATQGHVEIFLGNPAFQQRRGARLTTPADLTYGFSLDGAGDTNGDGYADAIVGQPGASDDRGRAHVYLGSAAGLTNEIALTLLGRDLVGARFGYALAGGADVDNDGYGDVVVAGPGLPVSQGGAYAFRGSPTGLGVLSQNILVGDGDPDSRHGASVAHVGDINGDGFSDFAVGAPGNGTGPGRVLVYLGGGGGLSSTPTGFLSGPLPAGSFGAAIAGLGDLDGDGVGDFAVGAPSAGANGRVTVFYGQPVVDASLRRAVITGLGTDGGFGSVVASVDPISNTFLVGAPRDASAARYLPTGTTLPTTPVFVFSVASAPGFGSGLVGVW